MKTKSANQKYKEGFTLIEMLVVMAMVGVLSSAILLVLKDARAKSRDSKRYGDARAIATALNLYFNKNNSYPTCPGGACETSCDVGFDNALNPLVTEDLMAAIPHDPRNNESPCNFYYAYVEKSGTPPSVINPLSCGGLSVASYAFALTFIAESAKFDLPTVDGYSGTGTMYCLPGI